MSTPRSTHRPTTARGFALAADKWDVYWRTHTLDKDGKIIDAP
ncbi:hypothetical protein ACGFYP_00290 [Streptomyces sp. NPDC048370]